MTSMILSCLILAGFETTVVETPVNEYAMATINKNHHGLIFEGTVVEEKLNSVSIEVPEHGIKTLSYAMRDHTQRSLSTLLDFKNGHASIDCEIKTSVSPSATR